MQITLNNIEFKKFSCKRFQISKINLTFSTYFMICDKIYTYKGAYTKYG